MKKSFAQFMRDAADGMKLELIYRFGGDEIPKKLAGISPVVYVGSKK